MNRRSFIKLAGALGAVSATRDLIPGPEGPGAAPRQRRPARTLGLFLLFHILPKAREVEAFKARVLETGANTIVVDIKNPGGFINVPIEHRLRPRQRSYLEDPRPVERLLNWADRNGVYAIARQVVMMDAQLATFAPNYVLKDLSGLVWKDLTGTAWANPFEPLVADYNAAVAEAAVKHFGFRQVQYDLIRFPSSDSRIEAIRYARRYTAPNRVAAIAAFLRAARERLKPLGALLTADLFGYSAFEYQGDLGIGQDLARLAPFLDGASPMAYPSLYRAGILLRDCPDFCKPGIEHPYEVVNLTVQHTRQRLQAVNPKAFVEPWIQAYLPARQKDIDRQQQAAFDAGALGVLAWHTNFRAYQARLFEPALALR